MSCPRCQGTARQVLAPNWFECETEVPFTVRQVVPEPGSLPGSGRMVQVTRTEYRRCGHRYQEGAPSGMTDPPSCFICGTFAVGRCADCNRFVCGLDSERIDDRLVCPEHRDERLRIHQQRQWDADAPKRAAEAERRQQQLAELRVAVDAYESRRATLVEHLGRIENPAERLVVAIANTFTKDELSFRQRCDAPEVLCHVLPDMFRGGGEGSHLKAPEDPTAAAGFYRQRGVAVGNVLDGPVQRGTLANPNDRGSYTPEVRRVPWRTPAVAKWFADRARGVVPFTPTRALFFEPRWRSGPPKQGWLFESTTTLTFAAYTEKPPRTQSMFIDKNGRCWRPALRTPVEGGELSLGALVSMGELLRLRKGALAIAHPWRTLGSVAVVPAGEALEL